MDPATASVFFMHIPVANIIFPYTTKIFYSSLSLLFEIIVK